MHLTFRRRTAILLGWLLAACAVPGLAQGQIDRSELPGSSASWEWGTLPERYDVRVWTKKDGLPQNSVNAIAQTRDGYLWLGTFGGLVRFDGVDFHLLDPANTRKDLQPIGSWPCVRIETATSGSVRKEPT